MLLAVMQKLSSEAKEKRLVMHSSVCMGKVCGRVEIFCWYLAYMAHAWLQRTLCTQQQQLELVSFGARRKDRELISLSIDEIGRVDVIDAGVTDMLDGRSDHEVVCAIFT